MGNMKRLLGWEKTDMLETLKGKTFKIFGRGELFKVHNDRFWYMNWELRAWRLSSINLFVPDLIWFKEDPFPVDEDILNMPLNTDDISVTPTPTYKGIFKYI